MSRIQLRYLALLLVFCTAFMVFHLSGESLAKEETPTYILFVLDSSVSMRSTTSDRKSRLTIAKEVLAEILKELPDRDHLYVGLRVYGAQYVPDDPCRDSFLVHTFAPLAENREPILRTVQSLRPLGMTPLAFSLEEAGKDFPFRKDVRNILILLTDGVESCRGNPCAVSAWLQAEGIILEPYVIGLNLSPTERDLVSCIGKYYPAEDSASLKKALGDILHEVIAPTTLELVSFASEENVTEKTRFQILTKEGQLLQRIEGKPGNQSITLNLEEGEYKVQGTYSFGPLVLEAEGQITVKEQTHSVLGLDFGSLAGVVVIQAKAGTRDVSSEVEVTLVESKEVLSGTRVSLMAGNYEFLLRYREQTRRLATWVAPKKETLVFVDFGETPAFLEIEAFYLEENVTKECSLELLQGGITRLRAEKGQIPPGYELEPGVFSLQVVFQGVEQQLPVELQPGETKKITLHFDHLLGMLWVRVYLGEEDVTGVTQVQAQGRYLHNLPYEAPYRRGFLPVGPYTLMATNKETNDSLEADVLVQGGKTTETALTFLPTGKIRARVFLDDEVAIKPDVEIHVFQGETYKGQLTPCQETQGGDLALSLPSGLYEVVGRYLTTGEQELRFEEVLVTSGETTELRFFFSQVPKVTFFITQNEEPLKPFYIRVFEEDIQGLSQDIFVYNQETTGWETNIPPGVYHVEVGHPAFFPPILEPITIKKGENAYALSFMDGGTLAVEVRKNQEISEEAWVDIYLQGEYFTSATWDADLYTAFLPVGTYTILIHSTAQGQNPKQETVTIEKKKTTELVVSFDVGQIQVEVQKNGEPFVLPSSPDVHQEGAWIGSLEFLGEGSYGGSFEPGTYDLYCYDANSTIVTQVRVESGTVQHYKILFDLGDLLVEVRKNDLPYDVYWNVDIHQEGNYVGSLEHLGEGRYRGRFIPGDYEVLLYDLHTTIKNSITILGGQTTYHQVQFAQGRLVLSVTKNNGPYDLPYLPDVYQEDEFIGHLHHEGDGLYIGEFSPAMYELRMYDNLDHHKLNAVVEGQKTTELALVLGKEVLFRLRVLEQNRPSTSVIYAYMIRDSDYRDLEYVSSGVFSAHLPEGPYILSLYLDTGQELHLETLVSSEESEFVFHLARSKLQVHVINPRGLELYSLDAYQDHEFLAGTEFNGQNFELVLFPGIYTLVIHHEEGEQRVMGVHVLPNKDNEITVTLR